MQPINLRAPNWDLWNFHSAGGLLFDWLCFFLLHFFWQSNKRFKSMNTNNCPPPHCLFDRNINVDCILNFFFCFYFLFQIKSKKASHSLLNSLWALLSFWLIKNKREKKNKNFSMAIFFLFFCHSYCQSERIFSFHIKCFYLPNGQSLLWDPKKMKWQTKLLGSYFCQCLSSSLSILFIGQRDLLVTMPKQVLTTDK